MSICISYTRIILLCSSTRVSHYISGGPGSQPEELSNLANSVAAHVYYF